MVAWEYLLAINHVYNSWPSNTIFRLYILEQWLPKYGPSIISIARELVRNANAQVPLRSTKSEWWVVPSKSVSLKSHQLILIQAKVWKKSTLKKYLYTLYEITFTVRASIYLAHRSPGWQRGLDSARQVLISSGSVRCWDSWGLASVGCSRLTQLNSVPCGLFFTNRLAWVCAFTWCLDKAPRDRK